MPDVVDEKTKPEFTDASVGVKPTGRIRRIAVDRSACIGARSCVLVAGKTFQMDEQNLAYVIGDESAYEDDDTLLLAAQSCPVLAIHLYGEAEKKIFPIAE